jgi:serpin B
MDNIYISAVVHQANIDVDEKGTEAAAATAVGVDTGGGPSPLKTVTFRLNHPFLFVLRDVGTGAVLFMGRVVDPSVGR